MKRRKALILAASIIGTTIIGSEFFLSGCISKDKTTRLFSNTDIKLLDEVGEVILPKTQQSPGAKEVKIGLFMKTIVSDCYTKKEQEIFTNGIEELNLIAQNTYSYNFLELQQEQKHNLILELDKEMRSFTDTDSLHFFKMMKQLTIWGYFSSELGMTKALNYNPIPGKYIGCIPYKKGDKAWA